MSTSAKTVIEVRGTAVTVLTQPQGDYTSLTDMLKANDGEFAAIGCRAGLNRYRWSARGFVSQTSTVGLRTTASRSSKD